MKQVLVTGGTGFVGSNLAAALVQRGCRVRILRRQNSDPRAIAGTDVEHCIGDVLDAASVRRAVRGCDTVFHTAAMVTFEHALADVQRRVNVEGTRHVVEACIAERVRKLVHTSSIAAIGYPRNGELATEETPYNWEQTWGYKFSKRKAEEEVLAAAARGLDAVIVNPSVIVGEGDIHFHGGDILRRVKKWQVLAYVEGGMNVVYVGDVVNGHIAAAERGRAGERYILGGENLTHKEVFRRTAALVGGFSPVVKLPIPVLRMCAGIIEDASRFFGVKPLITRGLVAGAGRFNWFSSAKAERELAYTTTSFDEAIRRTFSWYRQHGLL